jgi:hypothetical protein
VCGFSESMNIHHSYLKFEGLKVFNVKITCKSSNEKHFTTDKLCRR